MFNLLFRLITLTILLSNYGCKFGPSYNDRSIFKSFSSEEGTVELYAYTSAVSDSPFYITIEEGDNLDTVCVTTNVRNIDSVNSNTLRLLFCGAPKKYDEDIAVPKKIKNWNILVDTTCAIVLPVK